MFLKKKGRMGKLGKERVYRVTRSVPTARKKTGT